MTLMSMMSPSSSSSLQVPASSLPPSKHNKNVGILAMEIYTPALYIDQSELECHCGVSSGKFTKGLGQNALGVVAGDAEDINSICLTVVANLLEK
jgi:hydroxymethylglutaryl-CoA synthase